MGSARESLGRGAALVWIAALLAWSTATAAQEASGPIAFDVTVVHVSQSPGEVDPRARRYDRLLGRQLRYQSLRVLESSRREVSLNEIESIQLPTGRLFRFRPLDLGERGVLIAVDAEKTAQGDFRIPKGKPLILGGTPYQDGQIVVILEPTD